MADILHILGTAKREGTGIARIVGALAKGLDPARYKLHAWFLDGDGPLAAELRTVGVTVRCITWRGGIYDPVGAWHFWRCIQREEFAIIHQHFGGRSPRWLARSGGPVRVITHVHGHFLESEALAPTRVPAQGSDLVIAVSQAVAQYVVGAPCRVVYAGVDIGNGGVDHSKQLDAQTQLIIGSAGRLVSMKGFVYLIRALALLRREFPRLRLEIAGSGPDRVALENEVQLHGLGENVSFLGWQTNMPSLLARWAVYVQPSILDPFPVATIDAMAAGLPVIATTAGGFPELVEEGCTGWLVPPRNPNALAERIRDLVLNPEQRHNMGIASRTRAREHFSVERMVTLISEIYEDVLSRRRAG